MNVESVLPIQKLKRKWSDRWKWVEVPIIPSYVFVRSNGFWREQILRTKGVVNILKFNGRDALVRQSEIDFLIKVANTTETVKIVSNEYAKGQKVFINKGIFKGYTGNYLRSECDGSVAVSIDEIGCAVIVKVSSDCLSVVEEKYTNELALTKK